MRVDFLDQLRRHRCIQANFHTQFFCLMRHRDHCLFHLFFTRRFSCGQELSAETIGRLAQNRQMSSLFQYDRRFQSGDSAACDQYRLRFLGRQDLAFFLSSDCRIAKTGDMRTIGIGKSVQTSLITSHTIIDLVKPSLF